MLKISEWLTLEEVSTFIKNNPEKVRGITEELHEVGCLNDKQFLAVVFLSILIGGQTAEALP